ncbi:hypothetical protein RB596_004869 [Gaeumannomyces avenae]
MSGFLENAYSLVHQDNAADVPSLNDLRTQLEKGTDESKVGTMKRILTVMLNGDPMPSLLMHIIRFVMPSKSKPLKKLLYFYYEICPKLDAQGKLKQEMILVCNGIRNDLQHPNEYIRGNTLRFLCKLREAELIEPLLSSARSCLEHRHAYVRKNAVFAVASIYQHSPSLIPDAAELISTFLEGENDPTCKRNAFAALSSINHDAALTYLSTVFDGIPNAEELLQLVELEFIRKDAVQNSQNKARYLRLIFDLLEAGASTVVYEAASSLTALTSNPVAVKAAATKFIELSIKEADNNVKLIVLDRVDKLRKNNDGILDDLVMEILRVLSSPDIDVRRKALGIALDMVSSKNVEEVVLLLKKELSKTVDQEYEKNTEYRQLLIHSIHQCAIKFSEVAASVVELLMDFIADFNNASAVDVINFVKEVVEKFPTLRPSIVSRLVDTLAEFSQRKELEKVYLEDSKKAFRAMVAVEEKKRAAKEAVERAKTAVQVDDVVSIRQLSKKNAGDGADLIEADLERATGGDASAAEDLSSKLSRVVQLTGFSDPVYAEAYVKVHQFDIVLDVLLVNQTTETLQNLSVEFATLGDLKVVERPTTQNLGPHDFHNVQCTIKVSSTDTGVIFGNVVYDGAHSTDTNVVILSDVHVDIMDYIQPATCTETQFRTMWTEFEWENKVNINSKVKTLRGFLDELMRATNMNCLTPEAGLKGDCQFLSANLYARSVFGEDALANLSIEKEGDDGPITGFVRIRSRSQGLALSLGSLKGLNKIGTTS